MRNKQGFTLVEMVIAIMLLTVGVLALLGTSTKLTTALQRGRRAGAVAAFASRRAEELRATACASQASGADTLWSGTTWVGYNQWAFTNAGNSTWRVVITTTFKNAMGQTRVDKLETAISCRN
jgi:prepilin-type N-terminal cleavage/methylation domain-containing protein